MLKPLALFGVVLVAAGHMWCSHLALQKGGYGQWAVFGVWKFIFTDRDAAKGPCTLMATGLLLILVASGLYLLGVDDLSAVAGA